MSKKLLPAWALALQPLDMEGAASVLGVSRRTLVEVLKKHQHFERRGLRKVFYPEHIEALREGMKQCLASKHSADTVSSMRSVPSPGNAYEKALALVTRSSRRSSELSTKRS